MSYKGTVRNGVVVLPPEAKLPEGATVEVISDDSAAQVDPFVAAAKRVKKKRSHWPKDYRRNLDHYLYGCPKSE